MKKTLYLTKRVMILLTTFVLLFSVSVKSYAHSGRTDENGGHFDISTGEYHYHHGYPAHQHNDIDGDGIIDCPYDFDDRTVINSGGSSSSNYYSGSNDVITKTVYRTITKEVIPSWVYWIISALFIAAIIMFFVIRSKNKTISNYNNEISEYMKEVVAAKAKQRDAEIKASQVVAPYIDKVNVLESQVSSLTDQLHECNDELLKKEKIERQKKSAPNGITFADDGMPVFWKENPDKPYGDYTVYYSTKSKIFHVDRFCASYSAKKEHIFNVMNVGIPCKKCAVKFFNFTNVPDWYECSQK